MTPFSPEPLSRPITSSPSLLVQLSRGQHHLCSAVRRAPSTATPSPLVLPLSKCGSFTEPRRSSWCRALSTPATEVAFHRPTPGGNLGQLTLQMDSPHLPLNPGSPICVPLRRSGEVAGRAAAALGAGCRSHGKHAVLLGLKAKPTAQDWAMSAFSRGPRFSPMAMVTLFLFEIQLFSEINSEIHLNF
jgi:hypothetical protein